MRPGRKPEGGEEEEEEEEEGEVRACEANAKRKLIDFMSVEALNFMATISFCPMSPGRFWLPLLCTWFSSVNVIEKTVLPARFPRAQSLVG